MPERVYHLLSRPAFLIGVSAIVIMLAWLLIQIGYFGMGAVERDMQGIANCVKENATIACTRPLVQDIIKRENAQDVLQEFSKRFTAQQCHYLGHEVGQALYRQYEGLEPALASCSRACDSACVHGAVGEAFTEEIGIDANAHDAMHLSPLDIQEVGGRLCTSISACHGVGHVLFQNYQQFKPALTACFSISTGLYRENCYRGVFMEYSDSFASKSIFATSSVNLPPASEKMCDGVRADERTACFWYLSTTLFNSLNAEGKNTTMPQVVTLVKAHCAELPPGDIKLSCINGIGATQYSLALSDISAAHLLCASFSSPAEISACDKGMVSMVMEYRRIDTALSYCKLAATPAEKTTCYGTIFSLAPIANTTVDRIKKLCDVSDPLCTAAASTKSN